MKNIDEVKSIDSPSEKPIHVHKFGINVIWEGHFHYIGIISSKTFRLSPRFDLLL